MSTNSLFDAQPYDEAKARRRRIQIAGAVVALIVIAAILWFNRYWPEKHRVDQFFAQLQAKDFEGAYAIWMNDPNWKQHPDEYKRYPFHAFYLDWGPGGEWGPISSYKIVGAQEPRPGASGVVWVATAEAAGSGGSLRTRVAAAGPAASGRSGGGGGFPRPNPMRNTGCVAAAGAGAAGGPRRARRVLLQPG